MIKINRSPRAWTPLALAIACGALALLWPDWIDELRAQGYYQIPQNLTVDCGGGPADHSSINAALAVLDPTVPGHTITVTGTCDEGDEGSGVEIRNFDQLTLQAPEGQTATISQPILACGDPGFRRVLQIINSTDTNLRRLTIRGGVGMRVSNSTIARFEDLMIDQSKRHGVEVAGGSVVNFGNERLAPNSENVIQDNCLVGVTIDSTSVAIFRGDNTIEGNRDGVQVGSGGFARFAPGTDGDVTFFTMTIRNNELRGVNAFGQSGVRITGLTIIENNGMTADPDDPEFDNRAGVRVSFGADVRVLGVVDEPGPEITNNDGPGILATFQTKLLLENSTIMFNTEEGVRLLNMSAANSVGGNTISDNGVDDITCDSTSLLFGDLTGISSIFCRNVEGDPGDRGRGGRP